MITHAEKLCKTGGMTVSRGCSHHPVMSLGRYEMVKGVLKYL